jgi:hypothetical protein
MSFTHTHIYIYIYIYIYMYTTFYLHPQYDDHPSILSGFSCLILRPNWRILEDTQERVHRGFQWLVQGLPGHRLFHDLCLLVGFLALGLVPGLGRVLAFVVVVVVVPPDRLEQQVMGCRLPFLAQVLEVEMSFFLKFLWGVIKQRSVSMIRL